MGECRTSQPRFTVYRWAEIPNLDFYEFSDDIFEQIYAKFQKLSNNYDEQLQNSLAEGGRIRDKVIAPIRLYFFDAKFVCNTVLDTLFRARCEKDEQVRRARRQNNRGAFRIIDHHFRSELFQIYEIGKTKLETIFGFIESRIWQEGFGDASEQWIEFCDGENM